MNDKNRSNCPLPSVDRPINCDRLRETHPPRLSWDRPIAAVALLIRQSLQLEDILQATAGEVRELLGCDRVLLYELPDSEGDGPIAVETVADSKWSLTGQTVGDRCFKERYESDVGGYVGAIADITTASLDPCHLEFLQSLQVRAELAVPLFQDDRLWGLLVVHHCTGPRPWQTEEIEGLEQIAVHVGIALNQAALIDQLRRARADLESQVSARTTELNRVNRQLEQRNQALQTKTEELESLFSVTLDLLAIADRDGRFLRLNQQWEKTLGYPAAEMEGTFWIDCVHPDDREKTVAATQRLLDGQEVVNFINRYRCRDGSYHWLEWRSISVGDPRQRTDRIYLCARDITQRQAIETELKALSARLSFALEAGQIGTWDWDCGEEVYWNDRMYQMWGLRGLGRKVEFQDWVELIHPEDIGTLETNLRVAREGKKPFDMEFRIRRPDGAERWLQAAGLLRRDESGFPLSITGICIDITDRKRVQSALQRSEARYRTIVETTLEGVWMLDGAEKTSFVNQQMATMLGYRADEMLGCTFLNFIDTDNRSEWATRHRGLSDQRPVKLCRRDGKVLWAMVSTTALLDESDNYDGCIKLLTDITPTVEMQEALERSQARLNGILNSSLDGIAAFESLRDETGAIVDFIRLASNPKACEMLGRSPEELIGKQLLAEMPGHKTDGLFDAYVRVVETGKPLQKEFRYNYDGIDCWFEIIAVKVEDGFAVTFRDITQIKESERKLQQVNRELGERLDDVQQRHREMTSLSEMSDFLQACTTAEEAWDAISYLMKPLFPNCSGGLFITCRSRNRVENVARWGPGFHSVPEFPPQDCWGLRRGGIYEVGVRRSGPRCRHISADGPAVTLCIPMLAQGETLGLLHLSAETAGALPEGKRQLARTVAEHLSLAIANLNLRETLHRQSIRDPLTGLFNRRHLEEALNQEIARARRRRQDIGIIMLDIDHFKRFNDTFGHEAGDQVLRAVGELLRKSVRVSDIVCRYGGEEMTIVLPESSAEHTRDRAEAIRTAIGELNLSYNGQHLGAVTASLGVACFPRHGATGTAVIQAADAALYRAKAVGRNCAIVAP